MEGIIRQVNEDVTALMQFYKIMAILGPRQVGKTTYALQLRAAMPDRQFEYVDLESAEDNRKLQDAETWLKNQQGKTVIIDEVQQRPELFGILRSVVDKRSERGQFILLGSASPDILRKAGETLAGRIHYLHLPPFSLPEVGAEQLFAHWVRGGFPESWLAPNAGMSLQWRKDYIDSFVYRDLAAMGFSITPATMRKLFQMTAHLHGGILNKSTLAAALGVSNTLVTNYVDILTGAFMLLQLAPWYVNTGKRLVKSPKIYLADTGLLHALLYLENYEDLSGHPAVGASWEGYVIGEIQKVAGSQWQYYFYRTHHGAECDLFCITGKGRKLALEIKLSNSPSISKGFYQSIADLQADESFVVVPTVTAYQQKDGITIIGLAEFLSQIKMY